MNVHGDSFSLTLCRFVSRELLDLVIHAHRQTLEGGSDANRRGHLGAASDLELRLVFFGVFLCGGGVVLPRHEWHPCGFDEVGIESGEKGLVSRDRINGGSARVDYGIATAGLVNDIFREMGGLRGRVSVIEYYEKPRRTMESGILTVKMRN